jgi:hypothetical protein
LFAIICEDAIIASNVVCSAGDPSRDVFAGVGFVLEATSARMSYMLDECYTCDSCGEEIVIPVDPSAGADQQYVEDCPVCCCPNVIRVVIENEQAYVSAHAE